MLAQKTLVRMVACVRIGQKEIISVSAWMDILEKIVKVST